MPSFGEAGSGRSSVTHRLLAVEPEVELHITAVEGDAKGPTLAVIAGVHGDEVECIAALEDWLADVRLDAGRLVAIPVAHPAALAAGTRLGPDGVDLNRVAPGDADSPEATRRLAAALTAFLVDEADTLITLHSWSRTGETVPYVEYPRSGAADIIARAQALAHALGLDWAEPWEWPAGLVPAAVARAGVPSVEVEVGGLGRTTSSGSHVARRALDAALGHLGLVDDAKPVKRAATVDRALIEADVPGRVRQLVPLGASVRAGQKVAEIRADDGSVAASLEAPAEGILAVHVGYGVVAAGDPVAVVFIER